MNAYQMLYFAIPRFDRHIQEFGSSLASAMGDRYAEDAERKLYDLLEAIERDVKQELDMQVTEVTINALERGDEL